MVSASESGSDSLEISGRDAEEVPLDLNKNVIGIVAGRFREQTGFADPLTFRLERALPLCGGLGASAAASVATAVSLCAFTGIKLSPKDLLALALYGEERVAGRHLDNIAPCLFGGLTLSFFYEGAPVVRRYPVSASWCVVVLTPMIRLETRRAREVLPQRVNADVYKQGLAHATGVALALSHDDLPLLSMCLDDPYALPARSKLVPGFARAAELARDAGAFAHILSGSGPTQLSFCADLNVANQVSAAISSVYQTEGFSMSVARPSESGARVTRGGSL